MGDLGQHQGGECLLSLHVVRVLWLSMPMTNSRSKGETTRTRERCQLSDTTEASMYSV